MPDDISDILLTLCALFAWYCFFRAALCAPAFWRGIKAVWHDIGRAGSVMPAPPPPPDPNWVVAQQRRMNLEHKCRNAKQRRLHDA